MTEQTQQQNPENAPNANRGFEAVLPVQSAAIYREFLAGRVITREIYNTHLDALQDNPLYNLLYNNLSHFREFYRHLGSELMFNESGAFFYLREDLDDESEEHDENAFRVQITLLLIGRYFARSGRDLEYLGRPDAGLQQEDIEALGSDEEYRDILRAARFEKGPAEALEYLSKRNFIFRSGPGRFFLSSAGMHFLELLVREYESAGIV
jgi:hypothetical protein